MNSSNKKLFKSSDPNQAVTTKSIQQPPSNATAKKADHKIANSSSVQLIVGSRWQYVQLNLRRIIEYGIQQGILEAKPGYNALPLNFFEAAKAVKEQEETAKKGAHQDHFELPVHDDSIIHQAIPFLPLPCAIFCLIFNVFIPGSGTVFSGIFGLCFGLPRLQIKEGKRLGACVINVMVGISQFFTITFMLVGWFWSIAWGGLMLTYALQYRQATKEKRQAVVATAALEAFTNDMLLRRRDIHKLVQKHKTPKQKQKEADAAAAAEAAHVKHAQMNTHTLRFGSKNAADVELGIRGTVTLATTIAQPVTNETHEESSKKHEKVKKKKKEAKKSVKFKK